MAKWRNVINENNNGEMIMAYGVLNVVVFPSYGDDDGRGDGIDVDDVNGRQ